MTIKTLGDELHEENAQAEYRRNTIGATIRSIHAAAVRDGASPVLWVMDYLAEKGNGRCSHNHAVNMISIHVTQWNALQRAQNEYAAETQIGHDYEEMESDL